MIDALKSRLLALGLLSLTVENRIRVVPPCVVTGAEVEKALSLYDQASSDVEAAHQPLILLSDSYLEALKTDDYATSTWIQSKRRAVRSA